MVSMQPLADIVSVLWQKESRSICPYVCPQTVIADLLLLLLEIYAQHDDLATSMYTCVQHR